MNGFFITGTDTDIGKTALSALLLAELRRRGLNAAPMKPAQTGCKNNSVPDLDFSLSMAQMTVSAEDYARMSPCRFEPACSPHLAAELAGTEIQLNTLTAAARALSADYDLILPEGAGGILVPINRRETMLDLMKALNLPVLLAARPGLGSVNHTLLSTQALRATGLNIAGIVLIESKPAEHGFIEIDNVTTIEQFSGVPILGTIPYCEQMQTSCPAYTALPLEVAAATEKIVNQLNLPS